MIEATVSSTRPREHTSADTRVGCAQDRHPVSPAQVGLRLGQGAEWCCRCGALSLDVRIVDAFGEPAAPADASLPELIDVVLRRWAGPCGQSQPRRVSSARRALRERMAPSGSWGLAGCCSA